MNKNIDQVYQELVKEILTYGWAKEGRNGDTLSVFGKQIRYDMKNGFPLLTTKKMSFKNIVVELLWFLRGYTNIKYLVDNGCHIWDGDCYQAYLKKVIRDKDIVRYLKSYSVDTSGVPTIEPYSKDEFIERIKNDDEFAKKWGELGPIYGHGWRNWNSNKGIDQISELIRLLKETPDSRRMVVSAWAVHDLPNMVLPPCHYGFQVYTRELSLEERVKLYGVEKINMTDAGYYEHSYAQLKVDEANIPTRAISLMWNQRSVDVPLGLPYNIASYALLLKMLADELNMVPGELIGNLGDCHIYANQMDGILEQMDRDPLKYKAPTVTIQDGMFSSSYNDFKLHNYESYPSIKIPLSN